MFCDDTALLYSDKNLKMLEDKVNKDLTTFSEWLKSNGLILNKNKTVYMCFAQKNKTLAPMNIKIDCQVLKRVKFYKYLGIVIDEKLSWTNHADKLISTLRPLIGAIRRANAYLTPTCKKLLYNALIQSTLTYLITIWSNTSQVTTNRLERLQNKAVKAVFNLPYETPTYELYKKVNVLPLNKLKVLKSAKLAYKLKHNTLKSKTNLLTNAEIHEDNTRNKKDLQYGEKVRTGEGINSPVYQAIKNYNKLPACIKETNQFPIFVKKLKLYLLDLR